VASSAKGEAVDLTRVARFGEKIVRKSTSRRWLRKRKKKEKKIDVTSRYGLMITNSLVQEIAGEELGGEGS
jgi:hypothetical protein